MSLLRSAAIIATSVVIMFFLKYQLLYAWDHAFFGVNRFGASLAMGAVMTCVMLGFMWLTDTGENAKWTVFGAGVVAATFILWVNRSQSLIDDSRFMKYMIPHHSTAINNARMASISDPRVRKLADQIIQSQVREIEEMELLRDDIEKNGGGG